MYTLGRIFGNVEESSAARVISSVPKMNVCPQLAYKHNTIINIMDQSIILRGLAGYDHPIIHEEGILNYYQLCATTDYYCQALFAISFDLLKESVETYFKQLPTLLGRLGVAKRIVHGIHGFHVLFMSYND